MLDKAVAYQREGERDNHGKESYDDVMHGRCRVPERDICHAKASDRILQVLMIQVHAKGEP